MHFLINTNVENFNINSLIFFCVNLEPFYSEFFDK